MTSTQSSLSAAGQLTPNRAARIELPVPHGTVAALAALPGGAADLGATVLLLPGYTGSKEDFAPLIDPLLNAGLGVVAVDLPGQHESGGPDDESAYFPAALGPVVAGLAASLAPRRVVLFGHSFGGLVARSAVLRGAAVSGLILLCSGPGELPPGPRRTMLEIGEPVMRQQGIQAAQRLREQTQAADAHFVPHPPELAEFHRARFLATSPSSLLGMGHALRSEPDRVDELAATLARASTPCLVACGDADDAWPIAAQRRMADRLGVPFATIPAAGHNPNVENPAGLLELLVPTLHAWLGTAL